MRFYQNAQLSPFMSGTGRVHRADQPRAAMVAKVRGTREIRKGHCDQPQVGDALLAQVRGLPCICISVFCSRNVAHQEQAIDKAMTFQEELAQTEEKSDPQVLPGKPRHQR